MAYAVLYVDDDEWRHDIVRHSLECAGCMNVTCVRSAAGALDMLAAGTFDAVIPVYSLPAMDGIAFLQAVRSRYGDLPVLFFSPEHSPWIREEAVRQGALSVHFMPLGMPEFREAASELTTAIELRRGGPAPKHLTVLDQAVLDSLPGMVVLWDSGLHLVQWNRNLETVSGYSPEELAGMNLRAVLPEFRPGDDFRTSMRKLTVEGQVSQDVLLHVRTGERVPYLVTFRRLEIGDSVYFAGTGTDIRERREAEDRCNHALTMCSLKFKLAEAVVQEQVPRIQYAAESMPGSINREEREKFRDTILAATDLLNETVWDAPPSCEHLRTGKPRWQDTGILLNQIRMPPGIALELVPPLPEVFASDLFESVFLNLVDHAARYGGPGNGRVSKVRVSVKDSRNSCVLQVEFNGTYIPWKEMEQIFRPGFQGVRGINLYQAGEILKRAGIQIQQIGPENPPTEYSGARFFIRIPHGRYRFRTAPGPAPIPDGVDESPDAEGGACWQAVAAVLARVPVPEGVALVPVPPLPVIFADISLPAVVSLLISYTCRHSGGVTRVEISAGEMVYGCEIRIVFDGTGLAPEEIKKHPFAWKMDRNKGDVNGIAAAGEILARTRIGIMASAPPGRGVRLSLTVPVGWYALSPATAGPPAASAAPPVIPGITGHGPAPAASAEPGAAPQPAPAAAVVTGATGQRDTVPAVQSHNEGAASPQAAAPVAEPPACGDCEELFRVLAETLTNPVLILDRDLRCRYASPGVNYRLGIPAVQFTGKTLAETGLPDLITRIWHEAADGVVASGTSREVHFRDPRTGELMYWQLSPVPGAGGPAGHILVLEQFQSDLNVEALQRASHTMRILMTVLNCDLLTRFEAVRGYSQMMREHNDPAKREDSYRNLDRIAGEMSERFKIFSRLVLESLAEHLLWIDVQDMLGRMQAPAGITLEIIPPLPEVFADQKLWSAFTHLLDYSARYGGNVTRVRISAEETPAGCVIQLEDNGAGIPQEHKDRIFKNYHVTEPELGPFIASQILAITEIRIRETGEPGKGTRFEITVPKGEYRFGPAPAAANGKKE